MLGDGWGVIYTNIVIDVGQFIYRSRRFVELPSSAELHNGVHCEDSPSAQKKQKYVTLASTEGQTRMTMCFPGRHVCECLAQKHELVNNCTGCGRIVCVQVCVCEEV